MFLKPPSILTRISAIFIGLVWTAAGAVWSWHNIRKDAESPDSESTDLCYAVFCAGVMLVLSGLQRSKPADFESETPDLHAELAEDLDD